jgi:hypothetical protein
LKALVLVNLNPIRFTALFFMAATLLAISEVRENGIKLIRLLRKGR